MAEELSPESKLYVKEEIEKLSKEFKQELKEAQSKATKTFTSVALIIGLLATVGILKLAKDYASSVLDNTTMKSIVADANELKDSCKESLDEANLYVDQIESVKKLYDEMVGYKIIPIYRYCAAELPYREKLTIIDKASEIKGNWIAIPNGVPTFYVFVKP